MADDQAVRERRRMPDPHASAKFFDALPKGFKNNFLLTRALTHRSYLNENRSVLEDNERLEFPATLFWVM